MLRFACFGLIPLLAACSGDSVGNETGDAGEDPPTWHQDVAPLVSERCTGCHISNGIAPMRLDDYETAADFADQIVLEVEAKRMPPWLAETTDECQPKLPFKDDPTLSEDEKAMLRAWAEAGAPEGDPNAAAELPEPASLELTTKDDRYTIPGSISVGGNKDLHTCWVVDPQLSGGVFGYKFLKGIQVNPGNARVVHHVLVYAATGQPDVGTDGRYECFGAPSGNITGLLAAWAPGAAPAIVPEGMGMAVPEDTQIVINVHYHPTGAGAEVDDSTSIDIEWLEDDAGNAQLPEQIAALYLDGNGRGLMTPPFEIPANTDNHVEEQLVRVSSIMQGLGTNDPIRVWMATTHMHYVGTDMLMGIQRFGVPAEEATECLVHTPRYDFNWQRGYEYDGKFEDYPILTSADSIYMRCTYNNTIGNRFVAAALIDQGLDEPVDVYLGDDTLDEMCLGVFGVALPTSALFP